MSESSKFKLMCWMYYICIPFWVAFKLFIISLPGFITVFKINFIIFNISLFLFLIPGPWLLSSW